MPLLYSAMVYDGAAEPNRRTALRVANALGSTVFFSLMSLLVLTAIPYGTSQPWWKAFFVCTIFALAILWLVAGLISDNWFADSRPLVLPLTLLTVFSFAQTLAHGSGTNPGGIRFVPWNAISADPYQTRFFALQLLALTLAGVFQYRFAASEKRVRIMINVVIGVAVASAIFGLLRQTTQHSDGFGLPLLLRDQGYGQFINKNHFAYLMESGLGLIIGLVLGGGVKRERMLIYFTALLPLWIALVLSGSRGGLIAMLAQIAIAALLFGAVVAPGSREPRSRVITSARAWPVRIALVVLLIGGVGFGTVWLGGDRLATRIEESRNELTSDNSGLRQGASRNEIWRASWQLFKAHPFLGVGMGGYWAAIPAVHNASGAVTPQEAHNDYLELLTSGGLLGLALGIWFAVVVVKRVSRNLSAPHRFRRAASFGAALGIAGVAVHSLVDFGLHTIVNALILTSLIVIATSNPRWAIETRPKP